MVLRTTLLSGVLVATIGTAAPAQTQTLADGFADHSAAMLLIDPASGRIVDANTAAARLYGYPEADLERMAIQDINQYTPEQVAAERRLAETERRNFFLFLHRRADGEAVPVAVHSSPVDVGGETLLWSIIQDITDLRFTGADGVYHQERLESAVLMRTAELDRARREIVHVAVGAVAVLSVLFIGLAILARLHRRATREKAALGHIVQHAPVSVVLTDADGVITYVNEHFTRTYGYSVTDVIGRTPQLLRSGLHPDTFYRDLWSTISAGQDWAGEFANRTKDGRIVWESGVVSPLTRSGRITGYAAVRVDVSGIKQAEEVARQARDLADRANRAKSGFLAAMSHELRTPLNPIIAFAEVIRDKMFGDTAVDRYAEYAGYICQAGTHLMSLINDILDIAKIESGRMEIDPEWHDACAVAGSVLALQKARAADHGLTAALECPDPTVRVWADPRALRQCLFNLLSNAVKYTPDGGHITVGVTGGTEGSTHIFVADDGPGIDPDYFADLMQPFNRPDNSYVASEGGAGLGLPLVKELVQMHGGEMRIESAPGTGTRVTLVFPPPHSDVEPDGSSRAVECPSAG